MKPMMTGMKPQSRMGTSMNQVDRPMTSNKGLGYNRNLGKESKGFEGTRNQFLFAKREPTSKEAILKKKEREIQKLFDESILLKAKGDLQNAKEKNRTAFENLNNLKSQNADYVNIELDFGIRLNLALICQKMKQYDDAKSLYQEILKLDSYYTVGMQHHRVRINLGNLLYQAGNYKQAITEYKKAVDKISKENKELRANVMRNIAMAYVKLGNYSDAIEVYTDSLKHNPDVKTAMNLLLCHLAVGNIENTKNVFNLMLDVCAFGEREFEAVDDNKKSMDFLREFLLNKKKENNSIIVNITLLLINYIDNDALNGFDYIIDCLKKNEMKEIVNEIEMAKAMHFLKKRDIEKTISIMKSFENKDKKLISRVSNNISFLYFIEGNVGNAEKYSNIALENERYNNKALVNMGNVCYFRGDFLKAKEYYLESIGVQSDCIEAIYNLGMVNIKMDCLYEAIQAFEKLNSICPNIPEVLYKIAKLYEFIKDFDSALKYYSLLLTIVPNDPVLLSNLGTLYYQINPRDEKMYMHYFEESFRYFPSNFDNLIILGFLYFRDEIYEKAVTYFELAVKVQPDNPTAEINYAKCFYKLGSYREALRTFKRIHDKYPTNREALTFLIASCKDVGISYDEYNQKLIKLEREEVNNYEEQVGYENYDYNNIYGGSLKEEKQENKYYEGEKVDFSKFSNKATVQSMNPPINKFSQMQEKSPLELLP